MVNHITIIGEACRGIPEDFRAPYSDVPWADIVAMHNLLIHHYFGIDLEAVWTVVERDIAKLNQNIQAKCAPFIVKKNCRVTLQYLKL